MGLDRTPSIHRTCWCISPLHFFFGYNLLMNLVEVTAQLTRIFNFQEFIDVECNRESCIGGYLPNSLTKLLIRWSIKDDDIKLPKVHNLQLRQDVLVTATQCRKYLNTGSVMHINKNWGSTWTSQVWMTTTIIWVTPKLGLMIIKYH